MAAILGASGDKNALNPDPPFQAVFMPTSLLAVQQLAPFSIITGKRVSSSSAPALDPERGRRAPGNAVFRPDHVPQFLEPRPPISQPALALKKAMTESGAGEADLWAALGYDFVRFTALLGAKQDSAEAFNQALATAAAMSWSMSPMRWVSGKAASQDLFLFQPTASGMIEADLGRM